MVQFSAEAGPSEIPLVGGLFRHSSLYGGPSLELVGVPRGRGRDRRRDTDNSAKLKSEGR
jgi:hypothetical protein